MQSYQYLGPPENFFSAITVSEARWEGEAVFHPDILSRGGGGEGQTRVLEMLRRGGINHQTGQQNKVKIQGGGALRR